jgi:hypothetical protein
MFTKSWDEKMVAAFYATNNEHAVLTTYLPGSENYGVENQSGRYEVPHICNLMWCIPCLPPSPPNAYAPLVWFGCCPPSRVPLNHMWTQPCCDVSMAAERSSFAELVPHGNIPHYIQTPCVCVCVCVCVCRSAGGILRNSIAAAAAHLPRPKLTTIWAAGLSFSKCHAELATPYDPHLPEVFDGEEISKGALLSVRWRCTACLHTLHTPSTHPAHSSAQRGNVRWQRHGCGHEDTICTRCTATTFGTSTSARCVRSPLHSALCSHMLCLAAIGPHGQAPYRKTRAA